MQNHCQLLPPMLKSKQITDEMPGGFFIYRADESEDIIYANKAMFRIFNCSSLEEFREHTGNSFKGIVHPDDLDAVERSIKQQIAVSKYDLDYVEYRIIQKGGQIRWIEDYGHFIRSDSGEGVYYVFAADATEKHRQMQAEKEALLHAERLREEKMQSRLDAYDRELKVINQEHLRQLELIEGLSIDYESIFFVDADTGIFRPYRLSDRLRQPFGIQPRVYSLADFPEFAATYATLWVCPQDREDFNASANLNHLRRMLSVHKVFHINYRLGKEENPAYMQLCIVNVGNTENNFQFMVGCRNIDDTIRQELRQAKILEEALERTKASLMVKKNFLDNMSHDIRTPMNAITGFTALAKAHLSEPDRLRGYLDKIMDASAQLLGLLDSVLELSELETGKTSLSENKCDLPAMLQHVLHVLQPQADAKNILLTLKLDQLAHRHVYCDDKRLENCLVRLGDNAVKYTKNGGKVTFSVTEQKASRDFAVYRFDVEDNGIGIRQDFLSHIFSPFERQSNTTYSGVPGTGLGLTITKSMVEIMGGTIEASSALGKGSRFTVTISFRLQDEKGAGALLAKTPQPRPLPIRILLADDNELNLELETELLNDAGFLTDTATDGNIAFEKVKNSPPGYYDLILMDIQMPVMDGYHATNAIRELDNPALANIPIVALSANAFDEDRKKSMESGMNAHLSKPVNIPQLLDLIEYIVCARE